jgi:hypothetical protein
MGRARHRDPHIKLNVHVGLHFEEMVNEQEEGIEEEEESHLSLSDSKEVKPSKDKGSRVRIAFLSMEENTQ